MALPGLGRGRWPEECSLSPQHSLAAGDDTSQRLQEILKIPALHKTRRAEDAREEEMGKVFLSAREGEEPGPGRVWDPWGRSHHPQHPRLGKGGTVATGSGAGRRTRAWISHCSLPRTIANSPAEGVVEMRILRMITHLPHFLKSLGAVRYSPHPRCCPPLQLLGSGMPTERFNLQGNRGAEDKNEHFSSFHLLARGSALVPSQGVLGCSEHRNGVPWEH